MYLKCPTANRAATKCCGAALRGPPPFLSMNSMPAAFQTRLALSVSVRVQVESTGPYFQSHADFFAVVFGEVNASLLKGFLYFDDGRDVSFHSPLVLLDALQCCQSNPSP